MEGHLTRREFYLVKELVLSWHPDLYDFFHREVRASVSHRRPGTISSFMSTSSDGGTRYKGRLNEELIRQICTWVVKLFPGAPILRLGRPLNEDAICEAYGSEEISIGKGNGGPERRWIGPEKTLVDDRNKDNLKVKRRTLLVRGVTNQVRLAFARHYEFGTDVGPPRGLNPWSEEHSAPGSGQTPSYAVMNIDSNG
ncbi:hypothetical protein P691DRAFT_800321 [Macrolepiota fuliginosa MF-IS2]|uniref:Uncharacterized protein n=1 Tax=Macrolepiota fuliginosa MF-IS2 TaxID=1400762 RepID=A0A9P6C2C9_9AGAR|nr:hypothetical protein P691DRAFT_800321 [Macrolepiota fuliginosa MF-IS2]